MLFDTPNISNQLISNDYLIKKNIYLSVARLDQLHPVVSGNKLFKLHYYLQEALENARAGLLTFGGTYSNHLVATAFACKTAGLKSIGFVRGEKAALLSPTLTACIDYGMQLHFISRAVYATREEPVFLKNIYDQWTDYLLVPEGGYGPKGAAGAALITKFIDESTTHICTAVGTATTLAGLVATAKGNQKVIGIPVLKGLNDVKQRIAYLTSSYDNFELLDNYHFGGYAKKHRHLLNL